MSRTSLFELDDVTVELSGHEGVAKILSRIDLSVAPGEVVGIVGRSGTGKTTLLRVLGGLVRASSGDVQFNGGPLRGPTKQIVTVFQDYGRVLLPWRTVARNVALGIEDELSKAATRERVQAALRMVGLQDRARDYPWRLSGGMQQRVQIARAIAMEPAVLLMDEPFGALDAITKAAMQDQLLEVREKTGATIVFITHDIDEAIYLGDQVVVIGGSPGVIRRQVRTGLPHPRDQLATRELPQYLRLRHELSEALRLHHDR